MVAVKRVPKRSNAKVVRKKKLRLKFNVDCKYPVEDGIMKLDDFEAFLKEHVKINGKTGVLDANNVKIELTGKTKMSIITEIPFSKRYLKYLTKKYLKRNSLRDWLRVISINRNTYELRYFNVQQGEEDSDNE